MTVEEMITDFEFAEPEHHITVHEWTRSSGYCIMFNRPNATHDEQCGTGFGHLDVAIEDAYRKWKESQV